MVDEELTAMRFQFEAVPQEVGPWILVLLPEEASAQLSSRGMGMIQGELNGKPFQAPVEPDGRRGHWFRLTEPLMKTAGVSAGVPVQVSAQPCEEWPDPELPEDLEGALASDAGAKEAWAEVTPKARWDWLRWVRSTNNAATRQGRVDKAVSMLNAGKRRPCCFDRNRCTEMEVSKNGLLDVDL